VSKGINKRAMDRQRARELKNQHRYHQREIKRQENLPSLRDEELEELLAQFRRNPARWKDDGEVGVKPLKLTYMAGIRQAKRVPAESPVQKAVTSAPASPPAPVVDVGPEPTKLVAERHVARAPGSSVIRARSAAKAASAVFDFLSPVFPKRIANEDLGDAIEDLNRMPAEGRPAWQIAVRAVVWFFILVMSVVRFFSAAIKGSDVKRLG
jgi:hypothetical protein